MDHAKFEQGEVLFDIINCRNVKIIHPPGSGDLHPKELYVEAMDGSRESYHIDKDDLYTSDEISAVLSHRDIEEGLKEMRRDRIVDEAPLLRYVNFDPDSITEDDIEILKSVEVELDKIHKTLEKEITEEYMKEDDMNERKVNSHPQIVAERSIRIIQKHLAEINAY